MSTPSHHSNDEPYWAHGLLLVPLLPCRGSNAADRRDAELNERKRTEMDMLRNNDMLNMMAHWASSKGCIEDYRETLLG